MSTDTGDVLGEYEDWMRAWASKNTREARVRAAKALLADCGGLSALDGKSIQAFIAKPKRNGRPKEAWSRATYHNHAKSFCEFLLAAGYVVDNPMEGLRSVKRPKKPPRHLSEVDVERVLHAATGDRLEWITVALATGMRVSEIAKLRGEDVTTDGVYVEGKGDVGAILSLHPDIVALSKRKPQRGYWWPGDDDGHIASRKISAAVGRLFGDLGLAGSIHRCRHTYATRLLRQGEHIRTVQQMMRHASLSTTAAYTAVDEDAMQLAASRLPSSLPPDAA